MSKIWLAVGLGNPGEKFLRTRHNAGVRAIDHLAAELGVRLAAPRAKLRPGKPAASVAETLVDGERLVLARPSTFMNESGRSVSSLLHWYRASPEDLIVVHDEIDLPEGALRIAFNRGSGGHRGVHSIVQMIRTQEFYRVRIGVGRPPALSHQDPAQYVLEPMSETASARLVETENKAAEAVLSIIRDGLELTMTRYNTR